MTHQHLVGRLAESQALQRVPPQPQRADFSSVFGLPPTAPWRVSCAACSLKGTCFASALGPSDLAAFTELTKTKLAVERGSPLVKAGEALHSIFIVHTGALKARVIARDGKEKVTAFYLPADIIALDAVSPGTYAYEVIALEDSDVCVAPFDDFQRLMHSVPALQRYFWRALSADISRDHGLVLLLGGMSAEQRLAAFLLSMGERHQRLGYPKDRFRLRMTRQDLASYIGLTLETVCRLIARFQREGLISLDQRAAHLTGSDRLKEMLNAW